MEGETNQLRVLGLPEDVTEEELNMTFKNKRRQGGGPVKKVDLDLKRHSAVITFEKSDAVHCILGRGDTVKIKEQIVKVEAVYDSDSSAATQSDSDDEDNEARSSSSKSKPPRLSKSKKEKFDTDSDSSETTQSESDDEKEKTKSTKLRQKNLAVPKSKKKKKGQDFDSSETTQSESDDVKEKTKSSKLRQTNFAVPKSKKKKKGQDFDSSETTQSESDVEEEKSRPVPWKSKTSALPKPSSKSSLLKSNKKKKKDQDSDSSEATQSESDDEEERAQSTPMKPKTLVFPKSKNKKSQQDSKSSTAALVGASSVETKLKKKPVGKKNRGPFIQRQRSLVSEDDVEGAKLEDFWDLTIKATVIDVRNPKDNYILYFEDDSVAQGDFDETTMMLDGVNKALYVTFDSRQAALDTCNFEHGEESNFEKVEMSTADDFDTYPNLMSVHGFYFSKEELKKFVEHHTHVAVTGIIMEEEPRSAIVVFDPSYEEPDIFQAMWTCAEIPFKDNRTMITAPVFRSCCLKVTGLAEKTTDILLKRYLSNQRSGGGGKVMNVNRLSESEAIVTLEDENSCNGIVAKRDHKVSHNSFQVAAHYPCLECEFYEEYVARSVYQEPEDDGSEMQEFSSPQLSSHKQSPHESKTSQLLSQEKIERVTLVSESMDAQGSSTDSKAENSVTERERMEKEGAMEDKKYDQIGKEVVEEKDLILLQKLEFHKHAESTFDVKVSFNLDEACVVVRYNEETDFLNLKIELMKKLREIKSQNIQDLFSLDQLQVLKRKTVQDKINSLFDQEGLKAHVQYNTDNTVLVHYHTGTETDHLANIVMSQVLKKLKSVDPNTLLVFKSDKGQKFLAEHFQSSDCTQVKLLPNESQLLIIAPELELDKMDSDIDSFIKENRFCNKQISLPFGKLAFIQRYCGDKVKEIEAALELFGTKLITDADKFMLKGMEAGINSGEKKLSHLIDKIHCHDHELEFFGIREYLYVMEGKSRLKFVEEKHRCVIRFQVGAASQPPASTHSTVVVPVRTDASSGQSSQRFSPKRAPHHHGPPPTSARSSTIQKDFRHFKVSMDIGAITKQATDIIVVTANQSLNLSKQGSIAEAVLKYGGDEIQNELTRKYPQGIQPGKIAKSRGGRLQCRSILHAYLSRAQRSNDGQQLEDMISKILDEAERQRATSVSIPALGTGRLNYPADVAARAIIDAISKFSHKNSQSSLKSVKLVIFPSDTAVAQAFEAELSRGRREGAARRARHDDDEDSDDEETDDVYSIEVDDEEDSDDEETDDVYSIEVDDDEEGSNDFGSSDDHVDDDDEEDSDDGAQATGGGGHKPKTRLTYGSVRLTIKKGNIIEEKCDAIVIVVKNTMDLSASGAVANAVLAKCGRSLQHECSQKSDEMARCGVVMTSAPGIKCNSIFHVSLDQFFGHWDKCIIKVLTVAENNGMTSIALPAFGTGVVGADYQGIKKMIFSGVEEFGNSGRHFLTDIRLVLFSQDLMDKFVDSGQSYKWHSPQKRNLASAQSHKWHSQEDQDTMFLPGPSLSTKQKNIYVSESETVKIYTDNEDAIKAIVDDLNIAFKDAFKEEKIKKKEIQKLSKLQVMQLEQKGLQHSIRVTVNQKSGLLTMEGFKPEGFRDVIMMLHELELHMINQHHSQLYQAVKSAIQWQFMQNGKWRDFESVVNMELESKHKEGEKEHEISDNLGRRYRIHFKKMKEYTLDDKGRKTGDTTDIRRYDHTQYGEPLPDTWKDMKKDQNLLLVTLTPGSEEYNKVEQHFKNGGAHVRVKKIERIQNKTLYQQYAVKKREIDSRNPKGHENEKRLFHGTSASAVPKINENGFNRSYCGKNATAYGEGVYFATSSSYSLRYAKGDTPSGVHQMFQASLGVCQMYEASSGVRQMYQARVLVGESTQSTQGMKTLPYKRGTNTPYDSGTDRRGMFIIFHDCQAYPEYLITF